MFECSCECLLWKVLEGPTRRCQNNKRKEGAIKGKLHVPARDLSVFTSYTSMARENSPPSHDAELFLLLDLALWISLWAFRAWLRLLGTTSSGDSFRSTASSSTLSRTK